MLEHVRVVLVRPRSPGNVGSVARAMQNFGVVDLWLVDVPEYEDPEFFRAEAHKMAWRAWPLVEAARRVATLDEALAEVTFALAASHRAPSGASPHLPPGGAEALLDAAGEGRPVALVFGSEADGLTSEELSRLAGVVTIPTGDVYPELNLSQAAVVLLYELYQAARRERPELPTGPRAEPSPPLPHAQEERLFADVRALLERSGFLRTDNPAVTEDLRHLLARTRITEREANLLRGALRRVRNTLDHGGGGGG